MEVASLDKIYEASLLALGFGFENAPNPDYKSLQISQRGIRSSPAAEEIRPQKTLALQK